MKGLAFLALALAAWGQPTPQTRSTSYQRLRLGGVSLYADPRPLERKTRADDTFACSGEDADECDARCRRLDYIRGRCLRSTCRCYSDRDIAECDRLAPVGAITDAAKNRACRVHCQLTGSEGECVRGVCRCREEGRSTSSSKVSTDRTVRKVDRRVASRTGREEVTKSSKGGVGESATREKIPVHVENSREEKIVDVTEKVNRQERVTTVKEQLGTVQEPEENPPQRMEMLSVSENVKEGTRDTRQGSIGEGKTTELRRESEVGDRSIGLDRDAVEGGRIREEIIRAETSKEKGSQSQDERGPWTSTISASDFKE